MTRQKIALVGDIRKGRPPLNGEQVKNQIVAEFLNSQYHLLQLDTDKWKKRPWIILQILFQVFFGGHKTIILSASSGSVHSLLRFLSLFPASCQKILYLVIGGYLPTGIRTGRYQPSSYAHLKGIVVEGRQMMDELIQLGVRAPIQIMPNCKPIKKVYGSISRYKSGPVRFIFVSRVAEPKGTMIIFEAMEHPLLKDRWDSFSVDFYGKIEDAHRGQFMASVDKYDHCSYSGYIDVTHDPEGAYHHFAGYHAMLFPTYWIGEGFPGVIIDAYVSGLPVIATDWNMNHEVVQDGITGKIIPARDAGALAEAMASVMDAMPEWAIMSDACHRVAWRYDAQHVLSSQLQKLI